ncbi:putative rapid ALkalinization Factor [Lupinus albus]|uniref:Putative rapid ALkalinization Factor n=1 Tax=Lupinus albus TaxID=3870 RepID=A0A6A4NZB8_LUPAL|nr:putative rapid ALkalinization Factor [Lupinus albus]
MCKNKRMICMISIKLNRYIGYNSLTANKVPCGQRGRSYYNCQQRGRANPYRRACTAVTHCARNVN